MCSKLFLTSCFVALIGFGSVHAAPKDTMITKINNLVSTFPTTSQLSKIIDTVANDMYNGATQDEIADDMLNVVLTSLNGAQLLKGMDIYNKITNQLGGATKAFATLDKINAAIKNQVQGTFDQIQSKTKTMKSNGQAKAAIVDAGLQLANQALTSDLVQKTVNAIKSKLTANEWSVVRKNMDGVILFSKYGV